MSNDKKWHRLHSVEALRQLGSSAEKGLSADEAEKRLRQYGPNELEQAHRVSAWSVLAGQFKNLLIVR